MIKIIIYHNPRCSKSRETLNLLRDRGIEPTIIDYLNHPPNKQQLKKILQLLNISARALMRKKEEAYKLNKLDAPELSEEQLIQALSEYPILMERPIVLANNQAAIGRPPENVLEILYD